MTDFPSLKPFTTEQLEKELLARQVKKEKGFAVESATHGALSFKLESLAIVIETLNRSWFLRDDELFMLGTLLQELKEKTETARINRVNNTPRHD
jgi:hypothetical protein